MSGQPSKFTGILRNRQEAAKEPGQGDSLVMSPTRGRPGGQGKRLNPNYAQVTAYIPKKLHEETKINLIRQGKREFSGLVEELLAAWNQHQPADR
jgi:hypothetical protein